MAMNFKDNKLILLLLSALIIPMIFGSVLPFQLKSLFYAFSLSIKGAIVCILPFMIFSFISYSLLTFRNGAVVFVFMLLGVVLLSNFSAIMIGFNLAKFSLSYLNIPPVPELREPILTPMWEISFPKFIGNETAMIVGILFGSLFSFWRIKKVITIVSKLNEISLKFLRTVFLPILPLFIMGFVIKLDHDDILIKLVSTYSSAFIVIVSAQIIYTTCLFFVAAKFSFKEFKRIVRNVLPATFTGFTTMSSVATMPVTILCTEKNMPGHKNLARTVVPVTANIHTLGSAIGVTVLSMGTLLAFGKPIPSIDQFAVFAIFFAIAKFAVVGIPGGVILVITPLLETHLGFTPEMIGIITTVYLLFDPFGTATNVTCNGAFAIVFYRFYHSITGKEIESLESEQREIFEK